MHDVLTVILIFTFAVFVGAVLFAALDWADRKLDPEGMTPEEHAARASRRQFESEVRRVVEACQRAR